MIFNFRKIASVLSSAVMMSSTVALAAAANFPAPFVQSGAADVAVVYGANAATTDLIASVDIQSALSTELARQTASGSSSGGASVTGESTPLFTSGTKLYINDSMNTVKNVLTSSNLPNVLKDSSFSGNVDASYTQRIEVGYNPKVLFKKQPTSADEPGYGLTIDTDTDQKYLYNATVVFSKEVNLSHADSEGEDIDLFGTTFTIASSTTATDLVLLKSADKISLSSDDPTAEVTVGGETYTIELVSASDSAATVKVTNAAGSSETKEINQDASKKINGISVAVTNADETNLKLSASIVAGTEKVTLTDNTNVKYGEEDTIIDGTEVHFEGAANDITSVTKIIVAVSAESSEKDAIKAGENFVDPVFGSFKLDFAGLNIPDDSTTAREDIKIGDSADDKMEVTFTDYDGKTKTINFAKNYTDMVVIQGQINDDGYNLSVREGEIVKYGDYIVVGNEDDGRLVKLSAVTNASESTAGSYSNDRVEFSDVFSGDVYKTSITADGSGTVSIKGLQYAITYWGASGSSTEDFNVTLNYPDSTGTGSVVLYPTIETKKGAKVAFYQPVIINTTDFRGLIKNGGPGTHGDENLTEIKIPDGDGYTSFSITTCSAQSVGGTCGTNLTVGTTVNVSGGAKAITAALTVGELVFNYSIGVEGDDEKFKRTATIVNETNMSVIRLVAPADASTGANVNIDDPAIIVFEEQDDNSKYEAWVVILEEGGSGDDGIGIEDIISTWDDSSDWAATMASDSKITKKGDLFGTIVTIDAGDSDQKTGTISYPDEQLYAQIYIGEAASNVVAATTSGGSVTALGNVLLTDAEASSASSKNLIVVGGSCINSVAADLLGGGLCGADFESGTGVGAGSFLIETFSRTSGKVATLVAGYNAGDTTNAAKYLTTQTVDTTAGTKYTGTSATSATLVTSETAA